MKKKLFLTIGSMASLTPLVISGACSTTWREWDVNVKEPESINFKKNDNIIVERYSVREDVLNKSAYEFIDNDGIKEVTINLSNINNPNELIYVLKKILNINIPVDVDDMWQDYTDGDVTNDNRLEQFINDIPSNLKISFKYKDIFVNSTTWNLDVVKKQFRSELNKIKEIVVNKSGMNYYDAIDEYLDMLKHGEKRNAFFKIISKDMKKLDIQLKGLLTDGQPVDVVGAANSAKDLINMPLVTGLMIYNGSFAFRMAKLTNLYKNLFGSVIELLKNINNFVEDIFKNQSVNKWIFDSSRTVRDKYNNIVTDENNNQLFVSSMDFNFRPVLNEGQDSPAFSNKSDGYSNRKLFKGALISGILSKTKYMPDIILATKHDEDRSKKLAQYKANALSKMKIINEEEKNHTGTIIKSNNAKSYVGEIPTVNDFIIKSPKELMYKFVSATKIDKEGKTKITIEITTENRIYEIPLVTIAIEVDGFTTKTKESEK